MIDVKNKSIVLCPRKETCISSVNVVWLGLWPPVTICFLYSEVSAVLADPCSV